MTWKLPLLALLWACGDAESEAPTKGDPPTDTAVVFDTADSCADVPLVTYASFGAGFLLENCQGCHASTTANRQGAPEEIVFDTVDDVWARSGQILKATIGEDPSMPPTGGITEHDRVKLQWWLLCADPGT